MHENNKTKSRAAIALALCFCVLVLTSIFAVKASIDKITHSGSAATDNETSVSENRSTNSTTPVVDSQKQTDNNSTTKESPTPAPERFIPPVDGNVQLKYSMSSLVYSKTLDQYMTHPGVDIHAELSTKVTAIADGTVSKVYNDDRYGVTVYIDHSDGLVSVYSNLAEQGLAETGDEVTQGQPIGCIGDTSLFESLDETHLHFEMLKDGNCTDPGDYIESLAVK